LLNNSTTTEVTNTEDIEQHGEPKKRSEQGQKLIQLAIDNCRPVRGLDGRFYVVMNSRPHIAIALGNSNSDAVLEVCNLFFAQTGTWAGSKATNLLSSFLTAQCRNVEPEEVNLRAGKYGDDIYLDMGDSDYRVIHIHRNGYEVLTTTPILFTRSHISRSLPEAQPSGLPLHELMHFVRIRENALPVLIACMISSWMTKMPQPIIFLGGSARSGKTTSLRFILDCIDPSTEYPGTSLTKDIKELKAQASLRRNYVFDNSSHVDVDVSDLLARITTGGELISRAHYTNDEAHVTQLMRTVIINGIMEGFTRGDLASRSVSFELQPIGENELTGLSNLVEEWQEFQPYLFTSLLEITSHVLNELATPREQVRSTHRNMDLVQIISIVSNKLGLNGMAYLEESINALSSVVMSSSVFSDALRKAIECAIEGRSNCSNCRLFSGDYGDTSRSILGDSHTSDELKSIIRSHTDFECQKDLPSTSKALGEALKRTEAELQTLFGIELKKKRTNVGVRYSFEKACSDVSA
jgi:hypothetical protein